MILSGQVSVTTAGRSWTLCLDFRALSAFEAATGKSSLRWVVDYERGAVEMASDMAQMCRAMLVSAHGSVDHATACTILDAHPDILRQVISAGVPEAGEDGAAAGKKLRPGRSIWPRCIAALSRLVLPRQSSGA